MVVLVPGQGKAVALDRVADEAHRPVMRARSFEGFKQAGQIVAAEIAHQGRQLVVGPTFEQRRDLALVAQLLQQPTAERRAAPEREGRVELVGACLDPGTQPFATGFAEGGLLQAAVTQHDHVPAEVAEDGLEPGPQSLAYHRVQALAVVVHHPPGVAQPVLPALQERLEDVALVHLGIADQGNHLAFRPSPVPAPAMQVVLHQRREQRLRDAQAHGARGEVHVVRVLGAGRVRLHAAPAAEALQLLERLVAEQVLDRMEDRAGVRLDRDPILGPERMQVQRAHDRCDRGAGRLVAADLQPVPGVTEMVGVVDRPGSQPQDFTLEGGQHGQVGGVGAVRRGKGSRRRCIGACAHDVDVRHAPRSLRLSWKAVMRRAPAAGSATARVDAALHPSVSTSQPKAKPTNSPGR